MTKLNDMQAPLSSSNKVILQIDKKMDTLTSMLQESQNLSKTLVFQNDVKDKELSQKSKEIKAIQRKAKLQEEKLTKEIIELREQNRFLEKFHNDISKLPKYEDEDDHNDLKASKSTAFINEVIVESYKREDGYIKQIRDKDEVIDRLKAQVDVIEKDLIKKLKNKDATLLQNQNKIQNLEKEKDCTEKELKYLSDTMASRLDSSMPKDFDLLYSVLTGKKSKVGPNYSLNLDLSCEKDMKFLQKLKGPIPDVKNLQMESLPQDCEEVVNRFMADNFPSRVGNFDFNLNSKLVRIDPYLDEILAVKARIQVKLSLYKLKLSKQQLCKVLEECKHLTTIGFNYCNLKIPSVPYFEDDLSESKIQYLGFDYSGDGDYSDWDQNPDEFCNLIKGLSYCEDFTANLSVLLCIMIAANRVSPFEFDIIDFLISEATKVFTSGVFWYMFTSLPFCLIMISSLPGGIEIFIAGFVATMVEAFTRQFDNFLSPQICFASVLFMSYYFEEYLPNL